jgi:REP element-mobilizing transposase RayT
LQFVTYRLADSVPAALLEEVEAEIQSVPAERMALERREKLESLLDAGHGSRILRDPRAARCVIENWHQFAGRRYDLVAWVVMPTHAHVLIRQYPGESLPKIVQSWKGFTDKRLKAEFPGVCVHGEFWKREYWDRYIRDEHHLHQAVLYIRDNPVKVGLAGGPDAWPYLGICPAMRACLPGAEV